jgi:pimeloyl-ACP methyl ester carboxylesterase
VSTVVLVHGAFGGAWCWYKLRPELESRGHDVVSFDLPAHGVDTTPPAAVQFDDYVERVLAAVDAQPDPVVLVGHSMAGLVVAQVTERRPEAVETAVYLSAYLPADGEAMTDNRVEGSLVTENFTAHEDRGVGTIAREVWDELFFADCSPSDRALADALVRPEPLDPLSTPVATTAGGFGSVRRVYVGCEEDRAITPAQQRSMCEAVPCETVLSLPAAHFAMLSAPAATADAVETAARAD